MNSIRRFISCALFTLLVLPTVAAAQDAPPKATPEKPSGEEAAPEAAAEEEDKELSTGVIASQGTFQGTASIDMASDPQAAGGEKAPVSGSVSRIGRDRCRLSLSNKDEEGIYRVSYAAIGKNERGVQVLRRTYSSTIKPKQTVKKEFSCRPGLSLAVMLNSGRKIN